MTKFLLIGLVASAGIAVLGFYTRQLFYRQYLARFGVRALSAVVDFMLTIGSTAVVAISGVFARDKWSIGNQDLQMGIMVILPAWTMLGCIKFLTTFASHLEKSEVKKLDKEIDALRDQRDWIIRTMEFIQTIVGEKFNRLAALNRQDAGITFQALAEKADPARQMHLILQGVHSFLTSARKSPDLSARLRLGIYYRENPNSTELTSLFEWDGSSRSCFSGQSRGHLDLLAQGTPSVLAQCALSRSGFLIVPDCEAANKAGVFEYLNPNQRNHLRSLVVWRFNAVQDKRAVFLLYVDSNKANFFESAREEQYKLFLEQATKRVEFELLLTELCRKASTPHHEQN